MLYYTYIRGQKLVLPVPLPRSVIGISILRGSQIILLPFDLN